MNFDGEDDLTSIDDDDDAVETKCCNRKQTRDREQSDGKGGNMTGYRKGDRFDVVVLFRFC